MSDSSSTKVVGCIGKCTSDLKPGQLDRITDNIYTTLSDKKGIEIFAKYLENRGLTDNSQCLELYITCCEVARKASSEEPSLQDLIDNVEKVRDMAENLNGVTQIDMNLMRSYNEALKNKSKTALVGVLKDTRLRCQDHLRTIHGSFKDYASQPCPLRK